ncbi:MAG TPA: glycosyltransferase family 1 protein [Candidatus Saccharimonadales bacterium]|nr:glycosyltransferase family 1 protein [Candidatus Saccharimonadales bacterium]
MKIAIDVSQIVYGTGVSNYIKNLVENLLKIDQENQYILFGSSLRSYSKLGEFAAGLNQYKNVEFKFIHFPPTILEPLMNTLRIVPIEKFIGEVDIFHSSDWTQPKVKSQDTKKVTTIHDMVPFLFPSSTHKKILSTFKRKMDIVKKDVDMILADSQSTKEDVIKFLQIDEEKIHVVYLAPSEEFKPQDDEKVKTVLEKYKIKKPYILSVATQEPRKNIQKLLDVFEQIVKERPEYHLVLSGKYGWGPGFHSPENVIWTGYVPNEDLIALYTGCRVFAYPSLYEGFGLPVLEAMACGAPVVTSNNSSMLEIAKDAAILVDPRSSGQMKKAMEMVLDLNMENYQRMSRASVERARRFTWQKTAKDTLRAYEDLVKNTAATKPEDAEPSQKDVESEVEQLEQKEEDKTSNDAVSLDS